MKFSLIIPVYNTRKYLNQCLDSVIAQTFKNFELILVDDGSTDGSSEICDQYANCFNNVFVIHKHNGGQSSARNYGTAKAKGEYILYLDSDDYYINDVFLYELNEAISISTSDITLFNYKKYFEQSNTYSKKIIHFPKIKEDATYGKVLFDLVKNTALLPGPCNKCIKRDIIDNNYIKFDETFRYTEDLDWTFQLMCAAKSVSYIDIISSAYRQNPYSVSKGYSEQNTNDYLTILEKWYYEFFNKREDYFILAMKGLLAKYYSDFQLYNTQNIHNKRQVYERLINLKKIYEYAICKRSIMIFRCNRFLGLYVTDFLLNLLMKMKKYINKEN